METEDTQIDYKSESDGENMCKEMKKDLKKHISPVHNGQKDYKCDSCANHFLEKIILKLT